MGSPPMQVSAITEERESSQSVEGEGARAAYGRTTAHELLMWIRALRSFFNLRNYPLPDAFRSDVITHNWTYDLRIVRGILLRCSRLTLKLIDRARSDKTIFDLAESAISLDELATPNQPMDGEEDLQDDSLHCLLAALGDAVALCDSLLESQPVSLHVWTNLGETLKRALAPSGGFRSIQQLATAQTSSTIPQPLLSLTRRNGKSAAFGPDALAIFSKSFELLADLAYVEKFLRRDESLKQTLPIFTLIHEEARDLANFIKTRALQLTELDQNVLQALDSTSYAIAMEIRKVFAHELVGISSLRQAPAIYIKVETAHGLLANSFRQSVIGLAHLFDDSMEGSQLFNAFQTRLDQSLMLRRDLWDLLQLVRRAEKEPEPDLIEPLLTNLDSFYEGSLRFLMFKDWEACERFMEEIGAARGAGELVPVLHRFSAFLEALSNQVSMRAVLANHPFDYPTLEAN